MPLISVIIPVYNVAPYIRECLDSVLKQNFNDYEICIVNDGSTDESGEICNEYQIKYSNRIKLYHQKNQGVSVARNKALEMASGDYIWFVDADDYILPDSLSYIKEIIKLSNADTIFFGNAPFEKGSSAAYRSDERNSFLKSHVCYCNPLMIFSRSIIEDNKLRFTVGMKMAEDLEFQYKYLLNCNNPVSVEYCFYYIRIRNGSASRNNDSLIANFESNRILLLNMLEYLKHFPESGMEWMTDRLAERLTSFIQSASRISCLNSRDIKQQFDFFIKLYEKIGYNICKGNLRIASVDVRLYYILYKLKLKLK